MAIKTTKSGKSSTAAQLPTGALDKIAAELAARRHPMTLAELLELTGQ